MFPKRNAVPGQSRSTGRRQPAESENSDQIVELSRRKAVETALRTRQLNRSARENDGRERP
jgi:hypothetical protein